MKFVLLLSLCNLDDTSPGFGVPSKEGGWDMDDPTSEWRKDYGPKIFCRKTIKFDHVFLDLPPFFKATIILKKHPKYYPCLSWTNCFFWMNFKQDFNCIFKTKAGNENKYRFVFQDIYLVAEHLRLNPLLWICWWPKKGYFHTER